MLWLAALHLSCRRAIAAVHWAWGGPLFLMRACAAIIACAAILKVLQAHLRLGRCGERASARGHACARLGLGLG